MGLWLVFKGRILGDLGAQVPRVTEGVPKKEEKGKGNKREKKNEGKKGEKKKKEGRWGTKKRTE